MTERVTLPDGSRDDVDEAKEAEEAEEAGPFAWLGRQLHTTPHRAELLVGVVLAVLGVAATTYLAREMWFTADEWEYLANRKATSLHDLTRPIGGHTTMWSVLLLRTTYNLVGVDFWPWFYIPRLIGHTLLAFYLWRVMRLRGANAMVAVTAYAVLLVLGVSSYQRALQIGTWMVYAALVFCALTIARRTTDPTVRDRVLVGVALVLAVFANGYAVAIVAGIIGALVLSRRIRPWIPSLLPASLIYLVLFLVHRDEIRPKPELDPRDLLKVPDAAFRVVRTAIESGTGLPQVVAAVLVIALLGWLISLIVRRRLDLFDAIMLLTVAAGLCALTLQRVAIDNEAAERMRYGYLITVLLSVVFVPKIRLTKGLWPQVAVGVLGVALLVANVDQFKDGINVRVDAAQQARVLSVEAAGMLEAGEPTVPGPSTLAHGLEIDELALLVDEGYDPEPLPEDAPGREDVEADARGALRMGLIDTNRPRNGYLPPEGEAVATDAEVDGDGCVRLVEGEEITGTVNGPGRLDLRKTRPQSLQLVWTDEFGVGRRFFDDPDVRAGTVELAEPTDTAELQLVSPAGAMTVCGFAAE